MHGTRKQYLISNTNGCVHLPPPALLHKLFCTIPPVCTDDKPHYQGHYLILLRNVFRTKLFQNCPVPQLMANVRQLTMHTLLRPLRPSVKTLAPDEIYARQRRIGSASNVRDIKDRSDRRGFLLHSSGSQRRERKREDKYKTSSAFAVSAIHSSDVVWRLTPFGLTCVAAKVKVLSCSRSTTTGRD